jgi:hypothetical protein
MNPAFEDETAINPFDMWTGANFKLKIRKVEGYQNYDKSEFESSSPLLNDDDALEKIWKSQASLLELVADKEFKPYDVLKTRLDKVLGVTTTSDEDGGPRARTTVEQAKAAPKKAPVDLAGTDDDDMAYFSKLAEED